MMPYSRLANASFKTTHGLYSEPVTTIDEYTAAAMDKNMIVLTALNSEKVLAKGKELFTAMCQHCHGEKGDGNGPMVASGAYSGVPNYAERAGLSDGQMFYSIYYGKGMMGSHRSLLNKKEIWTVIHYIRSLQSSEYGKFNADGSATVADTTNQN
jgi:mono/diheme cytochrome c family protein